LKNTPKPVGQWLQIVLNCMPDDWQANAEVFVDHHIAHTAHFQPGEFRVFLLDFERDVASGLADDFRVTASTVLLSARNCS